MIDEHLTAGDYSLGVDATDGQGTFTLTTMLTPAAAPFQPIPLASTPSSMVTGDFTGDGKLDLAVTDSDGVQILLANGDGTFQPARTVAAGNYGALVAGDFNGDGKLDLAVANENDDALSVLMGNGDGTFQPQVTYAVGESANRALWPASSMATASSTSPWQAPPTQLRHRHLYGRSLGALGQRRRHLPARGPIRGWDGPMGHRCR